MRCSCVVPDNEDVGVFLGSIASLHQMRGFCFGRKFVLAFVGILAPDSGESAGLPVARPVSLAVNPFES